MGHKINPRIFRITNTGRWLSHWFANGKNYAQNLEQDIKIRKYLQNKFKDAGLDKIEIQRTRDCLTMIIYSSKPGMIIGRGGSGIEEVRGYLLKEMVRDKNKKVDIDIKEVSKPQVSAPIVATNIAAEIERRIPYRRAMKRAIDTTMKMGAKGIKVICSGRLDGVEIARRETLTEGKIPLHTLRADIDYARCAASTTYGRVGVKVWIYKGEVF
jgi:small subunit ribosomal protein S3